MSAMNLPGFHAEASLYEGIAGYLRRTTANDGAGVQPALGRGYNCAGNMCVCSGDDDCNNMFTFDCGGPYAQCWLTGHGAVFCICSRSVAAI